MSILFLGIVFAVIVLLLVLRRPLYIAMLGGLVVTAILYRMPALTTLEQTAKVFTDWNSLTIILSLYLVTYLQRMLEARDQILLAQQDLDGIFHNRRVNATLAPIFIGLLPSAAAMILCGDIVKKSTDGHLDVKQQAYVTSWMRHVPECILPTYSSVLLMTTLSGVPVGKFMLCMLVPAIVLVILGYFPYVHRLPKDPGTPRSTNRKKDALHLVMHLWTLLLTLVLILAFGMNVVFALAIVIVLAFFVYRFSIKDILRMFVSAFDVKLLLNTFLVLVLKEFIAWAGVLEELPAALSSLPIPAYLIYAILFFVGGVISGASGIVALGAPIIAAAVGANTPLVVLMMCMCHAASQISPTHVCLTVAADYYKLHLGSLIRKTLPATFISAAVMIGYYHLMLLLGIT